MGGHLWGTKPRLLPAEQQEKTEGEIKAGGMVGAGCRTVSYSPLAKNSKKIFVLSFWESEVRSQLLWVKGRCRQAGAFEALEGNPFLASCSYRLPAFLGFMTVIPVSASIITSPPLLISRQFFLL